MSMAKRLKFLRMVMRHRRYGRGYYKDGMPSLMPDGSCNENRIGEEAGVPDMARAALDGEHWTIDVSMAQGEEAGQDIIDDIYVTFPKADEPHGYLWGRTLAWLPEEDVRLCTVTGEETVIAKRPPTRASPWTPLTPKKVAHQKQNQNPRSEIYNNELRGKK